MPRTADPTDIPRRLSNAGYALFQQQGYNATGIQQITDKAGVPKGSFYNHFGSKEAFAAQVLRQYGEWMGNAWAAALKDAPPSPLATLHHVFAQFISHHEGNGCQGCLVGNFAAEVAEASEPCRAELSAVMGDWRVRVGGLIAQAQQAGEVRRDIDALALADFFWDAWEGAVLRSKVVRTVQPLRDALHLLLGDFFLP
ncbi:MAG: TetR family transcriptional regulator [Rubrivivax sp.]|nr:MAG: TetR family transcriptional regulator [Rubrivivax sp.]